MRKAQNTVWLYRRDILKGALIIAASALTPAVAHAEPGVRLFHTSGCSCCLLWAKRLERAGFTVVTKDVAMGQLMRMKLDAGLGPEHASCHTALIDGYTVEGHVPVREIRRLLSERPQAAGLTVPGMPIGSPGMESGTKVTAYSVLLFKKDGSTEVYASYEARS